MEIQQIGAVEALISSIKTRQDGSVTIAFELNPENQEVINSLMNLYLAGEKLITLGIVRKEQGGEQYDVG